MFRWSFLGFVAAFLTLGGHLATGAPDPATRAGSADETQDDHPACCCSCVDTHCDRSNSRTAVSCSADARSPLFSHFIGHPSFKSKMGTTGFVSSPALSSVANYQMEDCGLSIRPAVPVSVKSQSCTRIPIPLLNRGPSDCTIDTEQDIGDAEWQRSLALRHQDRKKSNKNAIVCAPGNNRRSPCSKLQAMKSFSTVSTETSDDKQSRKALLHHRRTVLRLLVTFQNTPVASYSQLCYFLGKIPDAGELKALMTAPISFRKSHARPLKDTPWFQIDDQIIKLPDVVALTKSKTALDQLIHIASLYQTLSIWHSKLPGRSMFIKYWYNQVCCSVLWSLIHDHQKDMVQFLSSYGNPFSYRSFFRN